MNDESVAKYSKQWKNMKDEKQLIENDIEKDNILTGLKLKRI